MNQIAYKAGFKYQLAEPYEAMTGIIGCNASTDYFDLMPTGKLFVHSGYAWDGPSGPTVDTRNFMRGSLEHDVFYQAMRLGLIPKHLKAMADRRLYAVCREDGMSRIRAWWVLKGLEIGGRKSTLPSHRQKIHYAP